MQRVPLSRDTEHPNFIGSWLMGPPHISEELIRYFEQHSTRQRQGHSVSGVNLEAKNSIDIAISPKELLYPKNKIFNTYFDALFECYEDYTAQWPFLNAFAKELHIGEFNIQRYQTGQHFQRVHTERSGLASLHRLFAWMTYLNDVAPEDGGATTFTHYDLSIQPKKGLTLIWPAEWTHAHKGAVLHANAKYIITGWMHFPC